MCNMSMKHWIGFVCMVSLLVGGDASAMNRSENKPLVVILMGPPGAGKGTHAIPLSEYLHIPHISTGDLFRENIRKTTPLGQKAKGYIDQGQLVPDELVLDMLFYRVSQPDCQNGYILDGFPRTVAQAQAFDQKAKIRHRLLALNFNLKDEVIIQRIAGRIACKDCGRPYHKTYASPSQENLCDHCGGALYQRDDDKEEIIRKRLDVYRAQTEPLIQHYARQQGVLSEINSENPKEQVFHDVLEAVPLVPALH